MVSRPAPVRPSAVAGGNASLRTLPVAGRPATIGSSAARPDAATVAPTVTKSFSPTPIAFGGTSQITVTIANPNSTALTNIRLTDIFPSGMTGDFQGGGIDNTTCVDASGNSVTFASAGSFSIGGAVLPANSSCRLLLTVTTSTPGTFVNTTSTVTSNEASPSNTASATLNVLGPTITKSFSDMFIPLNGTTLLRFVLTNSNTGSTLTGVGFTDTLPAGLVVASPNSLSTTCGGTQSAVAGSSTVSLSSSTLANNASCALNVAVTGTTAGVKNNSVTATSSQGPGTTSTASLTVANGPTITKTFGAANLPVGGTTSLSFTLTNPSANVTSLTGVQFTDTLPTGLVVANPNGLTGTCGGGTITAATGDVHVTLNGGTLAVGTSCTFSVNVTANTAGPKNNSVTVSSTQGTGNTSTASLTVANGPVITKRFGAPAIPVNGTTTLTFTLSNAPGNTTPLTGVRFTDTFPAGLTTSSPFVYSDTCNGTFTAGAYAASISLSGATLGAQGCTISVNVTGTSSGIKNNSVTIASDQGTGNTSTASLIVADPATVTKTFGVTTLVNTETTTLTFVVTNPNTTTSLSGVALSDTLPAGITVATPNGVTGGCGAGSINAASGSNLVSLTGGTIAANSSCTFTVNVTGTAAGDLVNVTSAVTSVEGGTGNAATANLTVSNFLTDITSEAFQINYASNLNVGDGVVNITNTGRSLGATNPFNSGSGAGNICVNVYGFVPDEQLAVCCSCNVSPNSLHSFPIVYGPNALFVNPFTGAELNPRSVIIKLVATAADGYSCPSPGRAPLLSTNLSSGLKAWSTHSHLTNTPSVAITETPFEPSALSVGEAAFLSSGCAAIGGSGSGAGVCPGCQLGGLAVPALTPKL